MEERYGELQRFFEALWSQPLYRKSIRVRCGRSTSRSC